MLRASPMLPSPTHLMLNIPAPRLRLSVAVGPVTVDPATSPRRLRTTFLVPGHRACLNW